MTRVVFFKDRALRLDGPVCLAARPVFPAGRRLAEAFLYRCPNTGLRVQGWVAEDVSGENGETYDGASPAEALTW
jgi:hypothetical protein